MKIAVTYELTGVQRMEIAGFLGRRGDLASHAECKAFLAHAGAKALDDLPASCVRKPAAVAASTEKVQP
jgi:hypothetical protein